MSDLRTQTHKELLTGLCGRGGNLMAHLNKSATYYIKKSLKTPLETSNRMLQIYSDEP